MTSRPLNWPSLLCSFVAQRRREPFRYGTNDCCLLAADWVREITGIDPARGLRGKYRSALGAERLLRTRGGLAGLVGDICREHGWEEVPIARARRGDVVLMWNLRRDMLGICLGEKTLFAGGEIHRTLDGVSAWRIG